MRNAGPFRLFVNDTAGRVGKEMAFCAADAFVEADAGSSKKSKNNCAMAMLNE
jgi:hypothetical protein